MQLTLFEPALPDFLRVFSVSTPDSRHDGSLYEEAIKRIARLYAVEKEARGKSPEERAAIGQAEAKQIFDDLEG